MRSFQVFAAMSPEQATSLVASLAESSPGIYAQMLGAACVALKARPVYLQRQPLEKRAQAVRRALARVSANAVADEVLAVYFLECRKELLIEWLDSLGLEHEDGTLAEDAPAQPAPAALKKAVNGFLATDDPDRRLLLQAFSAQDAIDWPELEARLAG